MSKRNKKSHQSKTNSTNSQNKESAAQGSTHSIEKSPSANPPGKNRVLLAISFFLMAGWLTFLAFVAIFR